uniref:Uncharacterized protein n=1 Tax=Oryza barthii TaxID=65489 RepID=A0A0D3FAH3_9ORYZ
MGVASATIAEDDKDEPSAYARLSRPSANGADRSRMRRAMTADGHTGLGGSPSRYGKLTVPFNNHERNRVDGEMGSLAVSRTYMRDHQ